MLRLKVNFVLRAGLTDLGSPDPVPRDQSVQYTHGGIHVGNGASVINSKFVRLMVHNYCPTMTVDLDAGSGEFRGNTVLWENSLGAMQATYKIAGAAEFTAVGSAIESYGSGFHEALLSVERTGAVRVYGIAGRIMTHGPVAPLNGDGGKDYGAFDIEADSVLNLRPIVTRVLGPNMTMEDATANMILRPKTASVIQFGASTLLPQLRVSSPFLSYRQSQIDPWIYPLRYILKGSRLRQAGCCVCERIFVRSLRQVGPTSLRKTMAWEPKGPSGCFRATTARAQSRWRCAMATTALAILDCW